MLHHLRGREEFSQLPRSGWAHGRVVFGLGIKRCVGLLNGESGGGSTIQVIDVFSKGTEFWDLNSHQKPLVWS